MSNLSGILGELQAEGVLRLYHDYRSGSLRDWSGFGNDGTGSSAVFNKKGLVPLPSAKRVLVSDDISTRLTAGSVIVLGDFESQTDFESFISKRDAAGTLNYTLGVRATGAYFQDANGFRDSGLSSTGKKYIACSFTTLAVVSFYFDGIFAGNSPTACNVVSQTSAIFIGNWYALSHPSKSLIKAAIILSRPLTATEHQKLYQQLQQMSWPTKPYSRSMRPRYTEANNSGMQFRYSGAKRDGKYLDSSGNGNDSTAAVGTSAGKNGIGMVAGTSVVTSPVTTTTVPVSASHSMSAFVRGRVIQGETYGTIMGPDPDTLILRYGGLLFVTGDTLRLSWWTGTAYRSTITSVNPRLPLLTSYVIDYGADAGLVYINGVYANQLAGIDLDPPAAPVSFRLGSANSTTLTFHGTIGDGTLWNRALTTANIRKEWLQYAQMTQWKSGWGVPESLANESTANTFLGQNNSPYEIISGTWKITTRLVDGRPAKCLECIAAGTAWLDLKDLAINSAEAAYGSWAGRVYHAASATPTILTLTNSAKAVPGSVNGHVVRIYNAESRLSRNAAGTYTDLATVAHTSGAIIDVHAARRFDDVWQLYTKALGEAWATAASATDANYTVSQGMSLSANAGDYLVLGNLTGDHSWTKYLGEFDPREI